MKKHKILDKPILSYFLLLLFVLVLDTLTGFLDLLLGTWLNVIGAGNYSQGIFTALGAVLAAGIFTGGMLKGEYTGFLCKEGLKAGLQMVLPFTLLHVAGSLAAMAEVGTGSLLYAAFSCLAPGFGEEIAFRGCGVANYMRVRREEKDIPGILLLSGIFFGAVHITNILSGGDTLACVIQSVYAAGIGLFFGAVYLRTGNLWPTIISHSIVDFAELLRADLYASGGTMTGMILGDYITMTVGLLAGVAGIYMIRKEKRGEIIEVWNRKFPRISESE